MSSPSKTLESGNTTFYNLQNKRTLPREVIKWMQGLDLSYSVKDYRKDMSNGFLLAEIISRYEPGRIPMHAFENTQNSARRSNNWNQLHLFFRKQTLRDQRIAPDEYANVMAGKDFKAEQLYQLVCRLYTVCTKRVLPENAPVLDVPPTQTHNPNLTASYLLREDGLEKLETSGVAPNPNNSGLEASRGEEKSQERMPTRKMAPTLDPNANMVDVMGIGIKPDNRKVTSKRKSWEAQEESNYSEDNVDNEKLIFDYLNEMIEECIDPKDYATRDLLLPQTPKFSPTETLRKNLPSVEREFTCNFLNQVILNAEELVPILLRELNETWKFFSYFLKMARHSPADSQELGQLVDLLRGYALASQQKEGRRLQRVFLESLLLGLVGEVRASKEWRKREKLMELVYDFGGRELNEKKLVLNRLKELLGSDIGLYMEWLAVLVREETQSKANLSNRLIEDYIYYAHQHLTAANAPLRTASLKILYEISRTQAIEVIQPFFYARAGNFQHSQADPEHVMLLMLIYTQLLHELIASKDYQTLIKGNNANALVKVYNPDHEKNLEELKRKNTLLGETIYHLFNCTSDVTVREICARLAIPLIQESHHMMQIFLEFISLVREKAEFLQAEATVYELKSLRVEVGKVEVAAIEDYSNEILGEIIARMLRKGAGVEGYLFLINHCLAHLNIKKVNMEIWEDIALHVVRPYVALTSDPKHCQLAFQGVQHICHIQFNYDMKIRELTAWLAKSIARIIDTKNNECRVHVNAFNEFLNEEYAKNRTESIRFLTEELADLLSAHGIQEVIMIVEQ